MRFWIANNSLYDSKRNTYLYVSLDKETIKYKCKNFVDGYLGIFSNNLIDESTYYNECANKMRKLTHKKIPRNKISWNFLYYLKCSPRYLFLDITLINIVAVTAPKSP